MSRSLMLLAAAVATALSVPAGAAKINASPATLQAALASAKPGDTVKLAAGQYSTITISDNYSPSLIIEADGATVRGLVVTGGGLTWRGGLIVSSGGMDAAARAGYGALLKGHDITIERTTFSEARMAVAIDGARNVTIRYAKFTGLREDGVNASKAVGLTITHSTFSDFRPHPTLCTVPVGAAVPGLSRRACDAMSGTWRDGNHSDAIQFRNGTTNALFGWNNIEAPQGIGQMDGNTDLPCEKVTVIGNTLRVSGYHSATMFNCRDCVIRDNDVASSNPTRRTAIRFKPEGTMACGNKSRDRSPGTDACKSKA